MIPQTPSQSQPPLEEVKHDTSRSPPTGNQPKRSNAIKGLAITQLIIGIVLIVLSIFPFVAHQGIWSGLGSIFAAIIGIITSKK